MTRDSQVLHFECLTSPHALTQLRDVWESMNVANPFMDWRWLSSWWNSYGEGHSLYLVIGYQESQVRIIAPWYVSNSLARGKEVRFLGSGRACSDYMSLIQHPSNDAAFNHLAIRGLAAFVANDGRWDIMDFDGISVDNESMNRFCDCLQQQQIETRTEVGLNTWRLNVPESWDTYLGGCQKKIRQKLRRVLRDGEDRARFHLCNDTADLKHYFDQLVELHKLRRNELVGNDGCFDCDQFAPFLYGTVEQFFASNQLWLGQLDIDGVAAASCLALECEDAIYYYQTGANPEFKSMQPGWLLNANVIQHAIDRKLRYVDYLRGDEPYKARLSAEPIAQHRVQAVANHVTSKARDRLWQTARSIKHSLSGNA